MSDGAGFGLSRKVSSKKSLALTRPTSIRATTTSRTSSTVLRAVNSPSRLQKLPTAPSASHCSVKSLCSPNASSNGTLRRKFSSMMSRPTKCCHVRCAAPGTCKSQTAMALVNKRSIRYFCGEQHLQKKERDKKNESKIESYQHSIACYLLSFTANKHFAGGIATRAAEDRKRCAGECRR